MFIVASLFWVRRLKSLVAGAQARLELASGAILAKTSINQFTELFTWSGMIATAVVGLAFSIAVGVATRNSTDRIEELAFVKEASESLQAIQNQVASANDALFALRDFFDSTDAPVNLSEYQFFAKRLRERIHGLRDTGWAPQVKKADREVFQEAARHSVARDYFIRERDADGKGVAASERDVYFPILYPDPPEVTDKVLGMNITFEPVRRRAVAQSLATGLPALTPPLALFSGKGTIDGFMSFLPVYGKSDESTEPLGVVYGVFETGPLIESILAQALPGKDIGVYFYDPSQPPTARPIYWHPPSETSDRGNPTRTDLLEGRHWENELQMANQVWRVIFVPGRNEFVGGWSSAIVPVAAGLIVTMMIEAYLLISLRRTRQLERLTKELQTTAAALVEKGDKLAHIARHDPLTGLRNRAAFAEDAFKIVTMRTATGRMAVLMLDLDGFKTVNDTLGHAAGDQLLCEVSRRLNEGVRTDDVIARLGGDEFAIVQANAPQPEAAEELARCLIDLVSRPYPIADRDVKVGVSIGVAICRAGIFEIDSMLRRADKALYRAKLTGRGTWRLAADNGWEIEAA